LGKAKSTFHLAQRVIAAEAGCADHKKQPPTISTIKPSKRNSKIFLFITINLLVTTNKWYYPTINNVPIYYSGQNIITVLIFTDFVLNFYKEIFIPHETSQAK
jgi:hypothetical protein